MKLAALVLVVAAPAFAGDVVAKKDRVKTPSHAAVPSPGTKPAPLLNLYNEHTHEWLAFDPTKPPGPAVLDSFLRDHYTNKSSKMDPRLLDIMIAAAGQFHTGVVDVVSGFRHPKYNLILRKKGHQVARDSQHTHGNAIDFYLPGVPTLQLHAWAKAQQLGGVGLYLTSGFVHMDTGRIRFWSGD